MKLGQQLRIKQNQSLIMTPQLQQAIKLLQLSNVELAEFIENAKLENPFLKEKVDLVENSKTYDAEKNTPDICDNLTNTVDPLKNENITELHNTFDSHISSDFKITCFWRLSNTIISLLGVDCDELFLKEMNFSLNNLLKLSNKSLRKFF